MIFRVEFGYEFGSVALNSQCNENRLFRVFDIYVNADCSRE